MTTYRIRNWAKHFETTESKRTKRLSWLAMPNKHDGKSYRRLSRHPRAPEIFAAWCLMLQVASKAPERGALVSDDGPLDAVGLADMTGFPEAIFTLAFVVLTDPKIWWLDPKSAGVPADRQGMPADLQGSDSDATTFGATVVNGAGSDDEGGKSAGMPCGPAGMPAYRQDRQDITDRTGSGSQQPDETGGTEAPEEPPTLTDRELVRPLAPYVRWQTNDPERSADNLAELVGLIRDHGAQAVLTAARNGHTAGEGKLWPNEIAEHLPGATPKPTEPPPIVAPETAEALAILDRLGYQAAHDLMGYQPGKVPNDAALRSLITKNRGTAIELIRLGGGK